MSASLANTRERWHHRLPHWEVADRPHFITVRCAGSLPAAVVARLREVHLGLAAISPESPEGAMLQRASFAICEKYVDQGFGFSPFTTHAAARIVMAHWVDLEIRTGWRVSTAVAMPNHVHFILEPTRADPVPLRRMLAAWKGRVARAANLVLGRTGAFWQDSWFDRWLRHEAERERVADYIVQNPVKAGLVRDASAWPWRIP